MATLRKITLHWEIRTGAITCDTGYIKRQELCDVDLYVTVDGTAYALDTSWALNLSVKPALLGDNAALVAVTTWTASATTGLYQATAQTIGGTALDTYLAANNADTTDDEGNKLVDLDVYYTVSMAMRAKSDTVTVICKPDVGRTDDTVPATIIARNDFLVTNGTGLLVNVAAGYAANGAFVAAQASLAITNATNYIEVTAAGVASVNTTAFTAGSYPLATVVASAGAITANTDLRAWITPKPSADELPSQTGNSGKYLTTNGTATSWGTVSTGLTVGTTAIASGTTGRILYDNAGVLGELPVGTGVATALAVSVGSAGAFITFNGDAGTPSALVGTNISGTAANLTAGLVSSIGSLTGDVTSSNRATTLATVNSNVGAFTNASVTVNAKGLVTAASSGTSAVTSITGTANEITVTGTTTPTLSLPSALTFTGKTVTGGTFNGGAFNGTVGATTPSTVAGTTGTFSGAVTGLTFNDVTISHGLSGETRSDAIGFYALSSTTTGYQNTAIGWDALQYLTSGSYNVAVGRQALSNNLAGDGNTAIGRGALSSVTGGGNVALGYSAGFYETASNAFYVDNQDRTNTAGDKAKALLYGTFATTAAAQQLTINAGTITLNGSAVTATSYAGAGTGLTGTAASLTAGNVTTNANLTGHVTSTGNAAVLGSFTMAQLNTAVSDGDPAYVGAANTFTGATNTFTLPTTTGTTTTSGIAVSGNSLTTGTGIYLASSSLTSGKALDIQVSGTAAAASQTALNVSTAGANGTSGITSKGVVISNTHTGTTSTNTALELTASGGTTNYALNVTAGTSALQAMTCTSATISGTQFYSNNSVDAANAWAWSNGVRISSASTILIGSGGSVGRLDFSSGYTNNTSASATISRNADGILQIGTTTSNALGSLLLANLTASGTLITTPEALAPALNAGAACGVTTVATGFALNGVNALTLANGTNGQIKTIVCTAVTAAGTATLTPTTCSGFTTVAFTAAGQTLTLQYFTTGGWVILSVRGATPA